MKTPVFVDTKTMRIVHRRVEEAADFGVNSLIYGPPSSEKTFALEAACDRLRAAGKPCVYMYVFPDCTEAHLYRLVAEAAGIPVQSSLRWACRFAVLKYFQSQPKLPCLIFDEAQNLSLGALEGVRVLHDLTRRPGRDRGLGFVLAGSHGLLQFFTHPQRRLRLEHLLSRISHRTQLEGMSKEEVLTLAVKALDTYGKVGKLSEEKQKVLLQECTVIDPFYIAAEGKPSARTYYSSRRLLEFIRQQMANRAQRAAAD